MRLIVTNGDATVKRLELAGIDGDVLPWRDVLHDGPVRREDGLETLSQGRAAFLADEFGVDHAEVTARFAERDACLRNHEAYPEVELWFEHDLYDQLQLVQILDFFAREGRLDGLRLVQADDYLGTMKPDALHALAERAETVTPAQIALARHVWTAFTSASPFDLVAASREDTSALPHLGAALRRLLAEFPDPVRGLSLTEEQALRCIEMFGPAPARDLFRSVGTTERARFMGDASFFRRLDRLAFAREPLLTGLPGPFRLGGDGLLPIYAQAEVKLTELGHNVLDGQADHVVVNGTDRWIGGVHLAPDAFLRYDRRHGTMIAPP